MGGDTDQYGCPTIVKLEIEAKAAHVADPNGPGAKFDSGKSPMWEGVLNYWPRALSAVGELSAFGAKKYAWGNWKKVDDGVTRYSNALVRHLAAESYQDHDPETHLLEAVHVAWNALARLEIMLHNAEAETQLMKGKTT